MENISILQRENSYIIEDSALPEVLPLRRDRTSPENPKILELEGKTLINRTFEKKPLMKEKEFMNLMEFISNKKDLSLSDIKREIRIFDLEIFPNSRSLTPSDPERELFFDQKSLYLIHYIYNPPSDTVKDLRGIIVEYDGKKDSGFTKIVCKSFPYTIEFPCSIPEESRSITPRLHEEIPESYFTESKITIFQAYEGTIIRMWFYNNEWMMSTHRKIDARKSRWGGPYFSDMFYELLPKEDLDLYIDRKYCYIFLLHHPKNRLVVPCNEACLYHVGMFNQEDKILSSSDISLKKPHPKIKYPEKIDLPTLSVEDQVLSNLSNNNSETTLSSWEKLNNYVRNLSWEQVGVMVYFKDNSRPPMKILNRKYLEMKKLRGNEPNLRIRWFQCQKIGEEKALENLLSDRKEYWEELNKDNEEIIDYLLQYYKKRYESGKYKDHIEKELHWVLEAFHGELNTQILNRRKTGDMTEENRPRILKTVVERYNPRVRNALIREMKKDKNKIEE